MKLRACIVLAAWAAVFPGVTAAGEIPADIREMVKRAPGAHEFPQDDGLLLRQVIEITLDREGLVTRREETYLKMLTDQVNRAGWFDPRLDWNDARATLTVDQAYSIMTDGRVVQAQANSLVPNTDHAFEHAVPFAFMRQMTVAQVGVEHGGTTALAFTVRDRTPSGLPLWGALDLAAPFPILDQRLSISFPEGTAFSWAALFAELSPRVTTKDGMTTYAFDRRNVPPLVPQELAGSGYGTPRLVYSSARGWPAVRQFLERDFPPAPLSAAVTEKAREIAAGSLSAEEQVARLHSFVVDGIRTVAWPVAAFDYAVRSPEKVLEGSVGHPLEKAVLLAALLQAAGIEQSQGPVKILLAAPGGKIAPEVPSPVQFPEVWVSVGAGARAVFLDPAAPLAQRQRAHLTGRPLLFLDRAATGPLVWTALEGDLPHRAALRLSLRLEPSAGELAASGTADLDLGGVYHPSPGFDRTQDRLAPVARAVAAGVGNARVKELFPARLDPAGLAFRAVLEGGKLAVPDSGLVRVALPRPPGALSGENLQLWRARRNLPLIVAAPAREVTELALDLPSGYEVFAAPAATALKNAAGELQRSVKREERRLVVKTELTLAREVIEPGDYQALRELFAALEDPAAAGLWLRRKP